MPTLPRALARGVAVRAAGEIDLGFIQATAREVFLEYGSYDSYLLDWFRDEHVSTRLAVRGEEPAGFTMLASYPEKRRLVGELLAIAVAPAFQNEGIGKALLDDALERASEGDVSEVRLSVADGNSRAQRLFASRGFRLKEGIGVYPSGQRALLMLRKSEAGGAGGEEKA